MKMARFGTNESGLWRFDEVTGYWKLERTVTAQNARAWLDAYSGDDRRSYFKISRSKPSIDPRGRGRTPNGQPARKPPAKKRSGNRAPNIAGVSGTTWTQRPVDWKYRVREGGEILGYFVHKKDADRFAQDYADRHNVDVDID